MSRISIAISCSRSGEGILLLIAIRPSDRDVKPGGPHGAFRKE